MSVFSALLNNGPLLVGPLADRGTFDQYAAYRPGQVVVDGGVVYLNIAAVGTAPELEDTFQRQDQNGWGQSSHGEVWQTSSGWSNDGPPTIAANVGLLRTTAEARSDGQLLGPARLRGDAELLVRVALPVVDGGDEQDLTLGLNATEDGASLAVAQIGVPNTGITHVSIAALAAGHSEEDSAGATGPTITNGQACYLRLRRVGLEYSLTLWPAGAPEPTAPQDTLTAGFAQVAGHPLVFPASPVAGGLFAVSYLSVRPLTAATAPADDTDHWVALADALQVPQPY